ncbi:MAG: adenosylcobinamide-GDP ribazoletransferase [Desulfurococcales archaeon]|nr:adenosylcobinamide-GDP ribazoletransferase [Desulfurococcales archaeon]
MGFRDLLSFLTTLPIGGGGSLEGAAEAFPLAPLAGGVVGLMAGLAGAAAGILWGPIVAGVFYSAAYILLTGGLHLDGYADVEDTLGSGLTGGEALRVLKDPRRGSHALVMVAFNLLLSTGAAAAIYTDAGPLGLALAATITHAASGASMLLLARRAEPPPYRGLSTLFHRAARAPRALAKALAALAATEAAALAAAAASASWGSLAAALAPLTAPSIGVALGLRGPVRVLGFANGDVMGYTYEATRLTGLLAAALAAAALHPA